MTRYRCLLFDLDGTLVDSRADLINSVNLTLGELDLPRQSDDRILRFVGEGARLLVERALTAASNQTPDDPAIDRALGIFRRHYGEHLLDQTQPYPEVEDLIRELNTAAGLPLAIVTNKPYDFTVALVDGLGLGRYFTAVLGGDSLDARKPAPDPLLEAARRCRARPGDCLMVGDTRIDIEAGRAAGMKTCGFTGGFRGREELEGAGADMLIERFGQLREIVGL